MTKEQVKKAMELSEIAKPVGKALLEMWDQLDACLCYIETQKKEYRKVTNDQARKLRFLVKDNHRLRKQLYDKFKVEGELEHVQKLLEISRQNCKQLWEKQYAKGDGGSVKKGSEEKRDEEKAS